MMSRTESRYSSQRTWLLSMVVLAALWSISVQRATARVINDDCPNLIGNRDLYKRVEWICEDCSNIFRNTGMATLCRKNCFFNEDFLWCVYATERTEEMSQLRQWVGILGAGRE
uniref:Molt-inhibiting hormone n=1 Tax=Metacarcinus magister TaxID=29965 RepID=MIH_METMG|nr:RecName: Full=Molt-inhibiting hormone; Short=MIH; Flags: Precursor [Metacarcinus magister]AAC38984.1 molt-inhibiting hormone precursor [Metacarcinus magister]